MMTIFGLGILLFVVLVALYVFSIIDPRMRRHFEKLWNAVFWNVSLRTFIEGYLPSVYALFL
jgi:uncharacterized protein YqhQ